MSDLPELSGPEVAPASGGPAKQLVIFVHGYGANGQDLISLAQYFGQVAPDAAFISPDAPYRCDGAPFGFQWYDVWMQDPAERLAAIRSTAKIFDNFVTGQLARHGLTEDKLVLIGFSQGTMMSLFTAPRREKAIAGIVGYSGRMESPATLKDEIRSRPPVIIISLSLFGHGHQVVRSLNGLFSGEVNHEVLFRRLVVFAVAIFHNSELRLEGKFSHELKGRW